MQIRNVFFLTMLLVLSQTTGATTAASPQPVLERSSFVLPQDGKPMNSARVGPFCCTGDIVVVRAQGGDPLGYIYFFDMDDSYNSGHGAIAGGFAILISGAGQLDKPGAKQVEGRIPFYAAHFNPQSGWVQVGALQYRATVLDFAFERREENAQPYFLLGSLKVRVDVRIKGGATPTYRIRDGQLEITGTTAYTETCREYPSVEVKTAQGWRIVQDADLPINKPFYLDGKLENRGGRMFMCDVVICRPYSNFPVRTDEMSEEIFRSGTRQPGNIPEFKHRPVKGNIRVTVPYHTDTQCKAETLHEAVFEFKR